MKTKSLYIAEMSVDNFERRDAEHLENEEFKSFDAFKEEMKKRFGNRYIGLVSISTYMDELNDEVYPDAQWISYVWITI